MKHQLTRSAALCAALLCAPSLAQAQQSVDVGKQEYVVSCAVCHGENGKGGGPLVDWLKKTPTDLTKLQKNNMGIFPFDRVYRVIDGREDVAAHGPRDMPVWGSTYNREAGWRMGVFVTKDDLDSFVRGRILALIGYINSLQEK